MTTESGFLHISGERSNRRILYNIWSGLNHLFSTKQIFFFLFVWLFSCCVTIGTSEYIDLYWRWSNAYMEYLDYTEIKRGNSTNMVWILISSFGEKTQNYNPSLTISFRAWNICGKTKSTKAQNSSYETRSVFSAQLKVTNIIFVCLSLNVFLFPASELRLFQ